MSSLTGLLVVIGCLLAIVLLFSFYIFPNFVCGPQQAPTKGGEKAFQDPVAEFCKVIK
ncbi:MAG: hypothetical protein ABI348_04165 [Nitrososphaera sp.]|jgi:hypothetical protein